MEPTQREGKVYTQKEHTHIYSRNLQCFYNFFISTFISQVTEEVLSVLRLLHPLTEPESSQAQSSNGENRLDTALAQLQNVARNLAITHTQQVKAVSACTHIRFLTFIIALQSWCAFLLVGMLLRGMFALHILV